MPEFKYEFLLSILISVEKLDNVGDTPYGTRYIDILGDGMFLGLKLREIVLDRIDQKFSKFNFSISPNVRLLLRIG